MIKDRIRKKIQDKNPNKLRRREAQNDTGKKQPSLEDAANIRIPKSTKPTLKGLEPIGGGWYGNPPVEPNDCERYKSSPLCGGLPLSYKPFEPNVNIVQDECNFGFEAEPTIGFFKLPKSTLVWREPECRGAEEEVQRPSFDDDLSDWGDNQEQFPPDLYDDNEKVTFIAAFEFHEFKLTQRTPKSPTATDGYKNTRQQRYLMSLGDFEETGSTYWFNINYDRFFLTQRTNFEDGLIEDVQIRPNEVLDGFERYGLSKSAYRITRIRYQTYNSNIVFGSHLWSVVKQNLTYWKRGNHWRRDSEDLFNFYTSFSAERVEGRFLFTSPPSSKQAPAIIPPPLPTYPKCKCKMACCDKVRDNSELIEAIAELLGLDSFAETEAFQLIDSVQGEKADIQNYPDLFQYQTQQMLNMLGQWELKVKVDGEEKKISNVSEALGEMLGATLDIEAAAAAILKGVMLNLSSESSSRQALMKTFYLVKSIRDYLNFPTDEKKLKLDLPASLDSGDLKASTVLNPSKKDVRVEEFNERDSITQTDLLEKIVMGAEAFLAQNTVQVGRPDQAAGILNQRIGEKELQEIDFNREKEDIDDEDLKEFFVQYENGFDTIAGMGAVADDFPETVRATKILKLEDI